MRWLMRIPRLAGIEIGEFRCHGLAEHDAARAPYHRGDRRIGFRLIAGIDRRAEFGWEVHRVHDVLDPDREPAQRLCCKLRTALLHRLTRAIEIEAHERADFGFART